MTSFESSKRLFCVEHELTVTAFTCPSKIFIDFSVFVYILLTAFLSRAFIRSLIRRFDVIHDVAFLVTIQAFCYLEILAIFDSSQKTKSVSCVLHFFLLDQSKPTTNSPPLLLTLFQIIQRLSRDYYNIMQIFLDNQDYPKIIQITQRSPGLPRDYPEII